ncbi:MAG: tungstate ABC transporter substrate-binding protein WtpA [Anaerolineaceae bacterium]
MKKIEKLTLLSLICILVMNACIASAVKPKEKIVVFAAGSLIKPFSEIEKAFEIRYPEYDLQMEYHGSIQVMRHVTDLHELIDVVATADQSLIPMLMYATKDPNSGLPYATWYISMASNKIAIAYQPTSKYANEINADNWWEILSRSDVRVGMSDPRFDALGYRQLMVFALAQWRYQNDQIFDQFIEGQFTKSIKLIDMGDMNIIRIPDLLETTSDANLVMRGSSIALNSLLEAGEIDYAFEYESVIAQQGFEMLSLPPELNLGDTTQESLYNRVTVQLDFQRFASVKPVFKGELIKYGLTIPTNAPNPTAAAQFVDFLYGEEGQQIMIRNAQPLILPLIADSMDNLPEPLKTLSNQK